MLYLNIDEQVKIGRYTYSANYIDCPNFTFIKRISRVRKVKDCYFECGIDFSETPYCYFSEYQYGQAPHKMKMYSIEDSLSDSKKIIKSFIDNNVIQLMCKNIHNKSEQIILERLFEEISEKVLKKS